MQPKNHVDTTKPTEVTHLSLCTGYGGIDLGLARVVSNLRTVAYCEREAAAIELLLSRMEGGQLDAAPIWTDLRSFPWEAFSDRVDILSGGYPCQPFSAAGKRLGAEDERHLWPAIADGIRILRPRVCFFENVEGHISLGLREVIEELEGLGYRTAWGIFSAAEVGAPHQRKRVFIMANRCGEGPQGREWLRQAGAQGAPSGHFAECGGAMAFSHSVGGQARIPRSVAWNEGLTGVADHGCSQDLWPSRPGEPQHAWEPPRVVANTGRNAGERRSPVGEIPSGDDGAQGACETGSGGWEDEAGEWEESEPLRSGAEPAVGDTANERQPEWGCREMGQPRAQSQPQRPDSESDEAEREAEPEVGGGIDGAPDWVGYGELCISSDNRTDELRMLGNGVVPATASRAFVTLMEELL